MTGFGRGEASSEHYRVTVELASVNRKQADLALTLPKELYEHERALRQLILKGFSRGRITGQICLTSVAPLKSTFDYEKALALEETFNELSQRLGRRIELSARDFLAVPELSTPPPEQTEGFLELSQEAVHSALRALMVMRRQEGEDLKRDLVKRLDQLADHTAKIEKTAPSLKQHYHQLLLSRLAELGLDSIGLAQDERIYKEVALFVDRSDISEELTRLHSHFHQFEQYLTFSTPVGRSLDFLCQEIHREFNTIGSKSHHAETTHCVVTSKTELEKIREQVQNIE